MSRSKPLGLLQYLCLSEEERHFHQIKGYLPSDNSHEAITRTDLVNPPKDKGGNHKSKNIDHPSARKALISLKLVEVNEDCYSLSHKST